MRHIAKARWAIISPWLDQLLDTDPGQRIALLDQIRRNDHLLAGELEALLAQQDAANREAFLDGSALASTLASELGLAGQTIGAYTLNHAIGHGGMGSVWLAHRSDGRYEGQVAVKFLNLALLASGGERFRREGQVLARLAHPHVARLLDAGVTPGGQPYLVLEHIDGEPIDRWCEANNLTVAARVRLFMDVLDAVAHAHHHLILHRDLKPANILVAAGGQVKLLDFGIAKLMDDEVQPVQATGRAYTPEYAAPEQIQGHDVSTATDVYALGVVLYELLSGRHPTSRGSATPVERLQAVLAAEPARMSDALLRQAPGQQKRARALRGDLDNIVAKALKKAPAERYATAVALSQDLRRYLDHEPVEARPDAVGYRTAKFVRRHRLGVGAALTLAAVVVAGVAGTAWQAGEAAKQRDRVLAQLRRAETASDFISLMMFDTWGPDERLTLDQFLQRSEQMASRSLKPHAEQQSTVLNALGLHYGTIGNHRRAEGLHRQAVTVLPPSADISWRAQMECNLALTSGLIGDADAAQGALARWIAHADVEPEVAALCTIYRGRIAQNRNNGEAALRHALDAQRLIGSDPQASPTLRASLHAELGYGYAMNKRFDEADRAYAAAVKAFEDLGKGDSTVMLAVLNNWSIVHWNAGDPRSALAIIDRVFALAERRGAAAGGSTGAGTNRASALFALGRHREALAAADRAIAVAAEAKDLISQFRSLLTKAGAQNRLGDFVAADRTLEDAQALAPELPAGGSDVGALVLGRAQAALLRGQPALARDTIALRIDSLQARQPVSVSMAGALRVRAEALQALGERAAALRDAQAALQITQQVQSDRRHSLRAGQAWLLLARIKLDTGDRAGSRADAAQAAEQLNAMLDEGHPDRVLASKLARSD
jgi:eukaryotic-like serine/threonine-protein kinase